MGNTDNLSIDILKLRKDGVLKSSWSGSYHWGNGAVIGLETEKSRNRMVFTYTLTNGNNTPRKYSYYVPIRWTKDSLGRKLKPFFGCSRRLCSRVSNKLYQVNGIFVCQGCYDEHLEIENIRQHKEMEQLVLLHACCILEVKPDSTEKQVQESYRKLALKWHPDHNASNDNEAKERMQEINEALNTFKKHFAKNNAS
jgi:preprotein translocase subunit Sec63